MTPPKVLVADSISQRGIDELSRDGALEVTVKTGLSDRELVDLIPQFGALVVRSQTKVTADILTADGEHVERIEARPLAAEHQIVKATAAVRIQTDDLAIQHRAVRAHRVGDFFGEVRPSLEHVTVCARRAGSDGRSRAPARGSRRT